MTRSLILDQATIKCGFAIVDDESQAYINHGVCGKLLEHGVIKAPASASLLDRVSILKADILNLIQAFKVDELVIEDTRHVRQPSGSTNHAMALALNLCQEAARQAGIPCYMQHPSTIKACVTGAGNADKAEMISAVICLWRLPSFKIKDDNHADALAAAYVWLYQGDEVRRKASLKKRR